MPKPYREATYLLRRRGVWYFRFRIPAEIQSAVGRTELRLSLATSELTVARGTLELRRDQPVVQISSCRIEGASMTREVWIEPTRGAQVVLWRV